MPSTINATSTGSGGLISTGDASGQLELQANGSTKLTVSSSGVSFTGGIASPLEVTGNSTAGAEIRLPEDTDNGTNYVALKAANSIASNVTFTLPSADGTSGQVLQTNGSGTLSFATPASGALVYISSATASNSATISFTNLNSTYAVYVVEMVSIVPASGSFLYMRSSSNNGSSYDTTGYLYSHLGTSSLNSGTNVDSSFGDIGYIAITNNQGAISTTAADSGQSGFVYILDPASSNYTQVLISETHFTSATKVCHSHGSGSRNSTSPVNAIQFYMNSGNIASGTFRLYGIANS